MSSRKNRRRFAPFWTGLACCALGCFYSCNDGYDLMDEDPAWLGSSIYDYLKSNGNYTNVVRMIDDLGYTEVLARTGSKTLFVADDDAYARFYNNRKWGVGSYEDLSVAQKKQLLYGSMINNACQVAYLSSSTGPTEGDCMRRLTSASAYDTVPILKPEDMPDTKYWAYYKNSGKTIPCLADMTTAPMIHFIEAYLQNRRISNDDCNFLFNYATERKPGDANVNGVMMVEQNIRCSNGFVHKMGDVMTPLPNLANVIAGMPRAQQFSKMLDRFSAPYYDESLTREYNRLYGTSYDSVFQKRYFSERSQGGSPLNLTQKEEPVEAMLKFDPGWNAYYSELNASVSTDVLLQQDMAVMLVPTDAALTEYWENGAGKVLKDRYGTWENVPDKVLSKLLNVNMLNSFSNSVPSKFSTVLNDANDELKIKKEDVDSVFFACNGAVYLTNRVFSPVAYISVSFPALVNETMNIINWAIDQYDYDVYLNSQNSVYSFFIPTNHGLLTYVDPCSFGKNQTQIFEFHYDESAQTETEKVRAFIFNYDIEAGVKLDSIGEASAGQVRDRLTDILETHIVVGDVESGEKFYRTKDGGTIFIENAGQSNMTVAGGWQLEHGEKLPVAQIYPEENGKAYILDGALIQTARKSVPDILKENDEFSEFYKLMEGSSIMSNLISIGSSPDAPSYACPSPSITLFNTFHYTVYVPTNASIQALHNEGKLPTWDEVEEEQDEDEKERMTEQIEKFLKYHIQDNSLYIGQGNIEEADYETSAYEINGADNTISYCRLTVKGDGSHLSVTDAAGNKRNVLTNGGLYNLMAREYQYNTKDVASASEIYTSSYAVVHQIDGPLIWEKETEEGSME